MKARSTLDAKKVALTRRILAIDDPRKLDAIAEAIGSDGYRIFSEKEIQELKRIRDGMANGTIGGRPWDDVRRELLRKAK